MSMTVLKRMNNAAQFQDETNANRNLVWNLNDKQALCPASDLRIVEGEEAVFTVLGANNRGSVNQSTPENAMRLPYVSVHSMLFHAWLTRVKAPAGLSCFSRHRHHDDGAGLFREPREWGFLRGRCTGAGISGAHAE